MPQVTAQLKHEIQVLQESKWKQQLHIERTNAWWEHIGQWNASIDTATVSETEGNPVRFYGKREPHDMTTPDLTSCSN